MPAPVQTVAVYKLFLRNDLGYGWSEVYHQKPPSWAGIDWQTVLNGLFQARLDSLNHTNRIIYAFVGDVGVAGDIKAIANVLGNAGTIAAEPLGAGDGVYYRMHAELDQFTPRVWRGISKTDETATGLYDPNGDFAGGIGGFLDELKTASFGVFHPVATRRFAQYSFQKYIDGEMPIRLAHRDVGRPFGQLRGRRASTGA